MKMGYKKKTSVLLAAVFLISLLAGCGKVSPDMGLAETDLEAVTVLEGVQVVGLGEASHGVKEYQQMKEEVFRALVQNQGCRTFIIEGDFGSALKVDDYIHGGEGTPKEAAAMIGFRIYCTDEMEHLLEWMRTYNETAPQGEDLHFYGMDMQWADNGKDYLFRVLDQVAPQIRVEYEEKLAFLNDEDMFEISGDAFTQGMTEAEKLIQEVDGVQALIEEAFDEEVFAFARECACSLYACCNIRKDDNTYNKIRDSYMAEKVKWFIEHGDGSVIFINGHNGHIGKVNVNPWYDCLGKLLAEDLGDRYFAIGTDAHITAFNSQTEEGFEELKVENKNALNALAGEMD
ncbi:MAG: erythromycin esterase family protein, partial [Acetatifactor sp.]|nr:erythromycin esterase family protein [Acetatifactor sp.]